MPDQTKLLPVGPVRGSNLNQLHAKSQPHPASNRRRVSGNPETRKNARSPAGALTLSRGLRDGLTRRPALFYASKNGAGREAGWGWAPRDERGVYTCLCIAAVVA